MSFQAEVLRLGGADVQLNYLELLDNNITGMGANALGVSLSFGHNLSLLTLKLDYNNSLGDEGETRLLLILSYLSDQYHSVGNIAVIGASLLCKGLRTNMTLKQLHLQFCNLTEESGPTLAELLANGRTALEVLNLSGNRIGGKGLAALCEGLFINTKLETLCIADNMIDQVNNSYTIVLYVTIS